MEKLQKKIKGMVAGAVNVMIDKDAREWPPQCGFFAYQPKRPMRNNKIENHTEKGNV